MTTLALVVALVLVLLILILERERDKSCAIGGDCKIFHVEKENSRSITGI